MVTSIQLAHIVLSVTHQSLVTGFMILGLFSRHRQRFIRLGLVVFFGMIFNAWLKSLWQIKLPASVSVTTWAFPSGHTHFATLFWGYLACYYHRTHGYVICSLLLMAVGWALVVCGYHDWPAVWAAWVVAIIELGFYAWLDRQHKFAYWNITSYVLTSIAAVMIWDLPTMFLHMNQWLYTILGVSLCFAWIMQDAFKINLNRIQYGITVIVSMTSFFYFRHVPITHILNIVGHDFLTKLIFSVSIATVYPLLVNAKIKWSSRAYVIPILIILTLSLSPSNIFNILCQVIIALLLSIFAFMACAQMTHRIWLKFEPKTI